MVQLAELVELEQLIGKKLLIALLVGIKQVYQQLVLSRGGEGGVDFAV